MEEAKELCDFVENNPACHRTDYLIDYGGFLFCTLFPGSPNAILLSLLVLLVIGLIYFLLLCVLGFVTVTNLIAISYLLKMNEHSAGATVGVIIYTLSDVLSAFKLYRGGIELILGEMLGIAMYLRVFLLGMVICITPMVLYRLYFWRDMLVYIFAMIFCDLVSYTGRYTNLFEGIFAMLFYPSLCYIIYIQHCATLEGRLRTQENYITKQSDQLFLYLTNNIQITKVPEIPGANPLEFGCLRQFQYVINPLRSEIYDYSAFWQKCILICLWPIVIIVKLLVPIVDLRLPGDGWSKVLLVINFIVAPILVAPYLNLIGVAVCTCCTWLIALGLVLKLSVDRPSHQLLFAVAGACAQIILTNILAMEYVAINSIIGHILQLKSAVSGATLLTFANTIPEFVMVFTVIRWNYKTLPVAQFLVSPIFGVMFSLGMTTVLKSIDTKSVNVMIRAGVIGATSIWFIHIHNVFLSMIIAMANYQARVSIGAISISIYLLYILYLILCQYEVIHGYGTDHVDEDEFHSVDWA